MGWGMWVLLIVGTVAFWAVVLLGIRALFASDTAEPDRDHTPPPATLEASTHDGTTAQSDPSGDELPRPPLSPTIERHP